MERTLLNQAIATIKGELVEDGNTLALMTDDELIELDVVSRSRSALPLLTAGTCVILSGYPRFSPKTKKLRHLTVVACGFCTQRSPGNLSVSGRIFSCGDGQIVLQVTPKHQPAFFVPVKGFLPNAQENEYWRLECLLKGGLATLTDGKKVKNAYTAPVLKSRKRKHSKRREKVAA
ncbi:hypothetical protein [Tolypothrix sp. VBCCA 56010]|uniref:hypothetical protein n=1 Tax=Tolypothrix sp. VBCCA 56010 TaxID=3137731 RepID=UPI003D7EB0B9